MKVIRNYRSSCIARTFIIRIVRELQVDRKEQEEGKVARLEAL